MDFYSGFVYSMLDLPPELFTPMFAVARVAGWSAHRIEELANNGKIIRPAYKSGRNAVSFCDKTYFTFKIFFTMDFISSFSTTVS